MIKDTVNAYGIALLDDDPDRFGRVTAVGLDEVLFVKLGSSTASITPPKSWMFRPVRYSRFSTVVARKSPLSGYPDKAGGGLIRCSSRG